MNKRRFNWKARQGADSVVTVDQSETKKIKLSLDNVKSELYDDSNALVLPSKKRKTEVTATKEQKKKTLTKKQQKEKEKLKEKREKSSKRSELFKKLAEVQLDDDILSKMISTSDMQSGKWNTKIEEKIKATEKEEKDPERAKLLRIHKASSVKPCRKAMREQMEKAKAEDEIDTSDISTDPEWSCNETETKRASVQKMDVDLIAPVIADAQIGREKEVQEKKEEVKEVKPLRKTVYVPVKRSKKVEEERQRLPVCKEEQNIMETINENDVVIIQGETGTGKTTQIPQFLYEAGYALDGCMIGVTEPRRIAAISMSKRVQEEMNLSKKEVSYQIRYEGTMSDDTKIKFMTDGILLKEAQTDKLLERYNAIILDEAHERSLYTDVLIGLLSVIVRQRRKMDKPLKLIIMSATLKDTDFTENTKLFPEPPPVLKIDSRQYNVFVHFNKKTPTNYLQEAYKKICKINVKLPKGGILVFLTSQQEVNYLCSKLRRTFPDKQQTTDQSDEDDDGDDDDDATGEELQKNTDDDDDKPSLEEEEAMQDNDIVDDVIDNDYNPSDDDSFDDSDDDNELMTKLNAKGSPLHVLPLYAMLSSKKQAMVFEPPPPGKRLCVIATNVAETSITIPGIRYVVDTGKVKSKFYDPVSGVSTFRVTNISKASANQRSGRAGRTGPGHCYRLYSSVVYEDLEKYAAPEISKIPIDGLVLQLQYMNIKDIRSYPLPTPPPVPSVKAAEKLLKQLGALVWDSRLKSYTLTSTGRLMARIPVSPRYAKMLCSGHQHQLMPYAISIVAGLSIPEVFVDQVTDENEDGEEKSDFKLNMERINQKLVGEGQSKLLGDAMKLLKTILLFDTAENQEEFCQKYGVRIKAMNEIRLLRKQLVNILNTIGKGLDIKWEPNIAMPTDIQIRYLRNLMLIGSVDHVARKMPFPTGLTAEEKKKRKNAYQDMCLEELVFIHPSSVLLKTRPEFVVYQQIDETSRLYMKGITAIEPEWLPTLAPFDTTFDEFKNDDVENVPRYNESQGNVVCKRSSSFGPQCWKISPVESKLDDKDALRWFAKFLLDGSVCPKLKKLAPLYNCATNILLKDTAYCIHKSAKLLSALDGKNILNKEKLYSEWAKNSMFLYNEYCLWLPQNQHATVRTMWPPL